MKYNLPPRVVRRRGLSLLELTIVIATILSLLSILFVGTKAWKRGTDRSSCIMNIRALQMAMRSYQNMYGYSHGGRPYAENGTQDIAKHLFDKGYIESEQYEHACGKDPCPSGGTYAVEFPDVFPEEGTLFMRCSLEKSDEHAPKDHASW